VAVGETAVVTIRILPGQARYEGSVRNGVTSSSYGSWGGSYEFVKITESTPAPEAEVQASASITLDKPVYAPGAVITVTTSEIAQELINDRAWIAIYDAGAEHNAWQAWQYISYGNSVVIFNAPMADGAYEVRLYSSGTQYDDETLLMSVPFTVGIQAESTAEPTTSSVPGQTTAAGANLPAPTNMRFVSDSDMILLRWDYPEGLSGHNGFRLELLNDGGGFVHGWAYTVTGIREQEIVYLLTLTPASGTFTVRMYATADTPDLNSDYIDLPVNITVVLPYPVRRVTRVGDDYTFTGSFQPGLYLAEVFGDARQTGGRQMLTAYNNSLTFKFSDASNPRAAVLQYFTFALYSNGGLSVTLTAQQTPMIRFTAQ
jgi:hypothetical protein